MFPMKSIYFKLFATYLAILLVSFVVFSLSSSLLFRNDLLKRHQESLFNEQNIVIQHLRNAYEKGWNRDMVTSSLELGAARQDKVYYLFDQSGNLLYQVGRSDVPFSVSREIVQEVMKGKKISRRMNIDGRRLVLVASPINGSMPIEEKAIVMVYYGFERDLDRVQFPFVMGILISISFTALFIFFISKKITVPLREMNRIALKIAKGQFDQRVTVRSADEIGQLGSTLNYMAQELAGLDQMRKDFVANVSHDLRSPLTSIHGFLQALIDGTIPSARQKHYLFIIRDATERLIKLVNDLLDLAKLEAGPWEIRPVLFNLSEHVRQVIARMEPQFVKNNVQVNLISDEQQDIEVFADPDRIDQVMVNLLQNAIQFSPPNGTVDILLQKQDRAVVSVRDYGPGIKEEDLPYIWERFYKGDKARSKKVGTGIGLSIVKHILDLHKTEIQVESKAGEGTTFAFTLPIE